jgi:multiple sugar transport system permease protein
MSTLAKQKAKWGYIFVAPAVIVIFAVAIYPLLSTFYLSFTHKDLLDPTSDGFAGLSNYKKLFSDILFWESLKNTLIFVVFSVIFELIFGLGLALLMNSAIKGRGIIRAVALIPWAIPTVVSATMWLWLYNDQWGFINILLTKIGIIDHYVAWLSDPNLSLFAVIFSDVWKTTPFMALLILAGLQMVDQSIYESASVDGASKLRQFFSITLPMIKPTILVALLFRTLDSFRVFDLVYVMTSGGPGHSTEVLSLYAYKTLFKELNIGYGSALAVAIFILISIISVIYVKVLSSREEI